MLEQLNRELEEVMAKLRQRQKLWDVRRGIDESLDGEREQLMQLRAVLEKEADDLRRLEGLSLAGLFHTILGNKQEQMEQERQEYLRAKLRYDAAMDAVRTLENELGDNQRQLDQFGDLDAHYKRILAEKERRIAELQDARARQLFELTEALADTEADLQEVREAIAAGAAVLDGLERVRGALRRAVDWGAWDMVGGRRVVTAIKHGHIDDARREAVRVRQLLRRFQWELRDLRLNLTTGKGIGAFDTYLDYFFDGLMVDWIVQSKLRRSLRNAVRMSNIVQDLLADLELKLDFLKGKLTNLRQERQSLIENAQ